MTPGPQWADTYGADLLGRSPVKTRSSPEFISICVVCLATMLANVGEPARVALLPASLLAAFLYPPALVALFVVTTLLPRSMGLAPVVNSYGWYVVALLALRAFLEPNRRWFRIPESVLWMAMMLVVLLSDYGANPGNVFDPNRYVGYFLFPLTLAVVRKRTDFLVIVFILLVASVSLSLRVLHFSGGLWSTTASRVLDVSDPNYLSCWIGFGALLAVCLASGKTFGDRLPKPGSILLLALLPIMVGAMAATASRGALVALVASLLVFQMARLTRSNWPKLTVVVSCIALIALFAWQSPLFNLWHDRFSAGDIATANGRQDIWYRCLERWTQLPLLDQLFGEGTGSTYSAIGWSPHNSFLEWLMNYGVAGCLLLIGILVSVIRQAWRLATHERAVTLTLVAFLAVASLSVSLFYYEWSWILLAVVVAIGRTQGLQPEVDDSSVDPQPARRYAFDDSIRVEAMSQPR